MIEADVSIGEYYAPTGFGAGKGPKKDGTREDTWEDKEAEKAGKREEARLRKASKAEAAERGVLPGGEKERSFGGEIVQHASPVHKGKKRWPILSPVGGGKIKNLTEDLTVTDPSQSEVDGGANGAHSVVLEDSVAVKKVKRTAQTALGPDGAHTLVEETGASEKTGKRASLMGSVPGTSSICCNKVKH